MDQRVRLWIRFARSHVAVTIGHPIPSWSDDEVLEAFSVIRQPPVTFEEWCTRMGYTKDEPVSDPIADVNDNGIAIMKSVSQRLPWVGVA